MRSIASFAWSFVLAARAEDLLTSFALWEACQLSESLADTIEMDESNMGGNG